MARKLAPYPWEALEPVSRRAAREGAAARRALQRALDLSAIEQTLSGLLDTEVRLVLRELSALDTPPPAAPSVSLALADGSAEAALWLDPELTAHALGRVLSRPVELSSGGALDPDSAGALGALVAETARRAFAGMALRLRAPAPMAPGPGVGAQLSAIVGERAYEVWGFVRHHARPTTDDPTFSLAALGALPIAVPLVVGVGVADRDELGRLRPGDAWLMGAGCWLDATGAGRGALAAPGAELGVGVDLSPSGGIVVRELLPLAVEESRAMTNPEQLDQNISEAVADAPLVVRVEVGSVTLTAREWSALRPGDVIETGRRIAEPVVLRVAGREVARGELVNVEGELGVRIRQLSGGEP